MAGPTDLEREHLKLKYEKELIVYALGGPSRCRQCPKCHVGPSESIK